VLYWFSIIFCDSIILYRLYTGIKLIQWSKEAGPVYITYARLMPRVSGMFQPFLMKEVLGNPCRVEIKRQLVSIEDYDNVRD